MSPTDPHITASQDAPTKGRAASAPLIRQAATDPGSSEDIPKAPIPLLPAAQRILSESGVTTRPASAQSQQELLEEPVHLMHQLQRSGPSVVKTRSGSVLSRGFILKTDHYPSGAYTVPFSCVNKLNHIQYAGHIKDAHWTLNSMYTVHRTSGRPEKAT